MKTSEPSSDTQIAASPRLGGARAPKTDLRAGRRVGGGTITGLLGRGMEMALKLPRPSALTRLARGDLLREARIWLVPAPHPHVLACHYVLLFRGSPAVFLEYVEGASLGALLASGKAPEPGAETCKKILDLMIQAARGLGYLHSLGLRRLDIKPANLLLAEDGRLMLADFAATANAPPPFMGTREYFSPEAAENRASGNFPDLWALALSALECFMGRRPWAAGSIAGHALDSYLKERWAVPPSPPVADFFKKALAREMSWRHQSAEEMEADLMLIHNRLTGEEYARPRLGPLPESPERARNKALSQAALAGRKSAAKDFAPVANVKWF